MLVSALASRLLQSVSALLVVRPCRTSVRRFGLTYRKVVRLVRIVARLLQQSRMRCHTRLSLRVHMLRCHMTALIVLKDDGVVTVTVFLHGMLGLTGSIFNMR